MKTALVLIAHGSRNAEANADLHQLADDLRGDHDVVVPAFLELATPDIPQAVQTCVGRGAERVILLPYFLSAGVHVRRDLDRFRQDFARQYPSVEFLLAAPLGPHPLLVEIVRQRARESLGSGSEVV